VKVYGWSLPGSAVWVPQMVRRCVRWEGERQARTGRQQSVLHGLSPRHHHLVTTSAPRVSADVCSEACSACGTSGWSATRRMGGVGGVFSSSPPVFIESIACWHCHESYCLYVSLTVLHVSYVCMIGDRRREHGGCISDLGMSDANPTDRPGLTPF
jgi:hypothetical protein